MDIKCDATKKETAPILKCLLPEDHEGDHQNGDISWTNLEANRL